nr:hypothetical protein [Nitrosomonas nitrosa]
MPESQIPSADRATLLTDMLLMLNNLGNGIPYSPIDTLGATAHLSPKITQKLSNYGNDPAQIMQEVLHGSYSVDDLHTAISNLIQSVDKIDGNMNTTSIAILSHTGAIQQLSQQESLDHTSLFKEVAKLSLAAQAADTFNAVRSSGERVPADVSEFNANMQTVAIIGMSIATENGVNVDNVVNGLKREFKAEMKAQETKPAIKTPSSENGQHGHYLSFKKEPKKHDEKEGEIRSLRPKNHTFDEGLQNKDRAPKMQDSSDKFFNEVQKRLDRLVFQNGLLERFPFRRLPWDNAMEKTEGLIKELKKEVTEFGSSELIKDLRGKILSNPALRGKLLDSLEDKHDERGTLGHYYQDHAGNTHWMFSRSERIADIISDFRGYVTALHAYNRQHNTLDGAEKLLEMDASKALEAVENKTIVPPSNTGVEPMVVSTPSTPPKPS